MANKRALKKEIRMLCGDIAAEALLTKHLIDGADSEKLTEVLMHTAALQSSALSHATIAFDKGPKDFETKAAYRKARAAYYSKAYGKLRTEFLHKAEELVGLLNASLPKLKK